MYVGDQFGFVQLSRPIHPIRRNGVKIALLVEVPQIRAEHEAWSYQEQDQPPTICAEVLPHDSASCFLAIKNNGTACACVTTEKATNRGIETS